jgi:hypothetical protein
MAWQRFWCPRDARSATDNHGFIEPPSPRLRSERWESTTSLHLAAIPCLVLLGEPGIGKSFALAEMVEVTRDRLLIDETLLHVDLRDCRDLDKIFAGPEFLAWKNGQRSLCLFIDSLDERRSLDDAARLLAALEDGPRKRLRLRVACRTGELPYRFDTSLKAWWGGTDTVAHLELLPLARRDVLAAARAADVDAEAFLAEVLRADVVALATRPITLPFLIDQFRERRRLSRDRGDLYRSGCIALCREAGVARGDSGSQGAREEARRLRIARRIAAISVLAQKHVLYVERPRDGLPRDAVELEAIASGSVTPAALHEVVTGTRLFTPRGEGCYGWAHLTYAEFLAAEYVRARIPDPAGLIRILTPEQLAGQVPLALRGVACWIGVRDATLFSALLADDVSVLLNADLGENSDAQRAAITARLLEQAALGDLLDPHVSDAAYLRLNHPGLAGQLRPYIEGRDVYFIARRVAIGIAECCRLTALIPSLLRVACDEAEVSDIRARVLATLAAIAGPEVRPQLRPLLASPHDPDDQVRGHALAMLRAELDVNELIRHLVPPNNPEFLGRYYHFVNHELIADLTDEELAPMLGWLEASTAPGGDPRSHEFIERAATMLRRRAWSAMHRPEVLDRLTRIVATRLRHGHTVFGGDPFRDLEPSPAALLDDQGRRRTLVEALVASAGFPQLDGFRVSVQSGLIRANDLGWMVERFDAAANEVVAERWVELIACRMWGGGYADEDIEPVLALAERHMPLYHQLRWLIGPIPWPSAVADKMRQEFEANERALAPAQVFTPREGFDLPSRERLPSLLTRVESGDHEALAGVCSALRRSSSGPIRRWESANLAQSPGWSQASPEIRERTLGVVQAFLLRDEAAARTWFHQPSAEAYQGLRLLLARDKTWLDNQPAAFWRRWAPTIVACPIPDGAEDHVSLLREAYQRAPEEFLWALAIRTTSEAPRGDVPTARGLGKCWDDAIGALLLAKAYDPTLTGKGLAVLLGLLLGRAVAGTRGLCEGLLARSVHDPRGRSGALALLIADAEHSWALLTRAFAADPSLSPAVLHELTRDEMTAIAARCSESRIEDLYKWLAAARAGDPEHIGDLQSALRKQLAGRGTIAACDAIRRLRRAFPGDDTLAIARAIAREALSAKGWTPWRVAAVLALDSGTFV